jgi:predicted alpha-1,6-mannanase (GH76 family)
MFAIVQQTHKGWAPKIYANTCFKDLLIRPMKSRLALIPLLAVFLLLAFAPATLHAAQTRNYAKAIKRGTGALQRWYSPQSGLYTRSTGWWNSANAITVLANESRALKTRHYLSAIDNTFENASAAEHTANFLNNYDDDEGWWALAWVDAYDLTGKQKYLAMAETIFADIAGEWETNTCGGGVWWNKKTGYKNAIANELFLELAAALANRAASAEERQKYLDWAQREWTWFRSSGMINAQNLVNDGLDSTHPNACVNNGRTTWSYNQGVILGGLVELYKADPDPTLLPQAQAIAQATLARLTDANGILIDRSVSGGDAPQFKGIFLRNLMALYAAAPDAQYKSFAEANADSILAHDQDAASHDGTLWGALWQGPFDKADAARQTSALDALIAAFAMQ